MASERRNSMGVGTLKLRLQLVQTASAGNLTEPFNNPEIPLLQVNKSSAVKAAWHVAKIKWHHYPGLSSLAARVRNRI